MTITVTLTRDKTTKNTVVYKAAKGTMIDTLYIQQDAFISQPGFHTNGFPQQILVTVDEVNAI